MTWLVSLSFVIHRGDCRLDIYCETCESNAGIWGAIIFDAAAIMIWAALS